jgi:hypothetical protein
LAGAGGGCTDFALRIGVDAWRCVAGASKGPGSGSDVAMIVVIVVGTTVDVATTGVMAFGTSGVRDFPSSCGAPTKTPHTAATAAAVKSISRVLFRGRSLGVPDGAKSGRLRPGGVEGGLANALPAGKGAPPTGESRWVDSLSGRECGTANSPVR